MGRLLPVPVPCNSPHHWSICIPVFLPTSQLSTRDTAVLFRSNSHVPPSPQPDRPCFLSKDSLVVWKGMRNIGAPDTIDTSEANASNSASDHVSTATVHPTPGGRSECHSPFANFFRGDLSRASASHPVFWFTSSANPSPTTPHPHT